MSSGFSNLVVTVNGIATNTVDTYGLANSLSGSTVESPIFVQSTAGSGLPEWAITTSAGNCGSPANAYTPWTRNTMNNCGSAIDSLAGNTLYVFTVEETSTTTFNVMANYANVQSATQTSNAMTATAKIGMQSQTAGYKSYNQWYRMRYTPPNNGIMPTVSFGAVV